MPLARHLASVLVGIALLFAPNRGVYGQATTTGVSLLPHHWITILGHQDSLGLALTKALTGRIADDVRGTNVRITPQRYVDDVLAQGMSPGWDGKFTDEDMKELGKLIHTDLLVIVQAERRGETLFVRTGLRSPIRAPVREFLGTLSGLNVKIIVDSVVTAILADTTYRRLRSRDPQ